MSNENNTRWVLVEVVERDINTVESYKTYEDAFKAMKIRFSEAANVPIQDIVVTDLHGFEEIEGCYFGRTMCYGDTANHDNFDMVIQEIKV